MKKNLLSTALIALMAMFALPQRGWADEVQQLSAIAATELDFANETVDNSTGLTEITNYNNTGFYLRGNTASGTSIPIRVTNDNRSFNFSDATSVTRKNFAVLKSQTNNNYTSKPLVTAEYSSSNRMNIGFQTAIAGKVYIAFQSSTNPSEGNLFRLAFEGTIVKTASLVEVAKKNNRCDVMEYEATQGGTFFMDGYGKDVSVYYVKFVPETVSNPTLDVSTAGAAIITSGTSTLTGTGNYSITTYYKTSANSEENFTKEDGSWTEGTNVSLNSGGYVYAYSKNTVTGVTSEIVSAQITSNIAQYVLTLGAVSNGTISATVDAAAVSSGTNVDGGKTVTLTATPNTGYQLSGWTDGSNNLGDRPKSLVNTFTMNAATTVNATFEALPTLTGVTEESVWTFDSFAANTLLSDKIVYGYTNATGKTLYINGHNSGGSNQATIKSGNSTVTGISDDVTNYLYFYGSQDSDLKHNRTANSFTPDAASFKTGTAGTVSVYVQGPSGKNINIYEAINTTTNSGSTSANKHTTATTGSAQLVTKYVSKNADIFISCSGSPSQIYAVKFAPETVSTPSIAQEGNAVTITAGTSSASATVTTYYTTDGTDPTTSSTVYSAPFNVTKACTVKAITISSGGNSSSVAELACTYTPAVVNSAVTFQASVSGGGITVMNGETPVTNGAEIASGTTLAVTVSPETGYKLKSITVSGASVNVSTVQDSEDLNKYTFTMPSEAVTITAEFVTIYTTYDFRSFATSALSGNGTATPTLSTNVMTGSFTGDNTVTVTGSMILNDMFEIEGSKNTTNVKLAKSDNSAESGLQIARGSNTEIRLLLKGDGLKAGDWIKFETGTNVLHFNKVNNGGDILLYDVDDVNQTNQVRHSDIVSGKIYVAKSAVSSIELDYSDGSTATAGPVYIYSVQLSNGDAVPAPTIGDYDFTTGKVTITANNSLKGVTPTIYYTIDGSTPTTGSSQYTNPIELLAASTIKAIAVIDGDTQSTIAEKEVELETVTVPSISDLNENQVTITAGTTNNTTGGVTVTTYYTLDGSTPSASHNDGSFTEASKAIQIDQTRIVKAITISSTDVSSDVVTKKITVDAATPATTWDFANMTSLSYSDDATTIYYNGGNGSNFNYIVGSDIHSKMTWQNGGGSLAGETEKYLTGTSPFSINDLAEGDKVYITYTGGQLKVFRGTHGNSLKIGETTITTSGDYTFDSGAEIEVTAVDADYNYIALRQATATAKITKIEINPVYTLTNATANESGITVAITKENDAATDKTFESTFARGNTVTLQATYTATGKNLVWLDGEDNILTANNDGTVTITMDGNKTIKATLTIPVWTVNGVTVESYTESTAVDGVQIHGNNTSGHGVSVTDLSPAKTGSFSNTDATAYSVSKYLTIPGAVSASTDEIANKAATMRLAANNTESLKEYLAMDVTEAGTLYVLYRPNSATDGRNVYVGFQKNSDNSYTKTIQSATLGTEYTEIKHSGNGAGTFFVYGSIAMKVYAMMFVPETVKTLTTVASPADGGVIKVTNGNATYEGAANGLAIQPYTELTLAATANTGYNFTGWSDNVTSNTITMDDDKTVTATFEAVTYPLTITQPATGGSITATVDEISYTESTNVLENKTVTLTAVPADGYQLAGWTNGTDALGDLPKSLVNTITMDAAKSATATFEATPAVTGVTEESLWTFDSFTANTILSDTKVYGYNNGIGTLYISGHESNGSNQAKVVTGSLTEGKVVGTGDAIQPTNCLSLQGQGQASLAVDRAANAFTKDAIAFQAGVPGTVYVLLSGGYAEGRTFNIFANTSSSDNTKKELITTAMTDSNPTVISAEITEASSVFITTSTGYKNIYAVKFVPAPTYAVTVPTSVAHGSVVTDLAEAAEGETVTLTVTPDEGYLVDELTVKNGTTDIDVTEVTANSKYTFVMPAAAPTIAISFKAIPTIYATYDFRSFAKTAFNANGEASIDENETPVIIGTSMNTKVMKGTFTGLESATVTGSMNLKNVLGMYYSADNFKMKLVKTDNDATTGIAIPRGTNGQVELIMYGLKQGDWFKLETGDIPLYINKVNNSATISFYDLDDATKTSVARNAALKAGHTYVATADITTMELYYNTSHSGNAYLYSAQVSNADAIPAPTIGEYDFATGKVGITVNNSLKDVVPTVYYTTDGTDPTTSSSVYNATDKISLTEASTIKAVAVLGDIQSTVAEKLVELETVTTPTVGELTDGKVTITAGSSNNPSATTKTTYYTLDGSEPTTENNDGSFTENEKAIEIDQTRWIKVITISSTNVASEVIAQKVKVDAATPTTIIDFVKDVTEVKYGSENLTMYYYYNDGGTDATKYNKNNAKFNYIVNPEVHTRLAVLSSDQNAVSSTEDGLKVLNNGRPIAINDLHAGDKVYVTYTSNSKLKTAIYPERGDVVTIGETDVESQDTEIESGQEIVIKTAGTTYNYLMLMPVKDMVITKIEINPVYQITKGTVSSNISSLAITSPEGKTFDDTFARGTEVTLKATTSATGGEFNWTDGDGNVLPPSAGDPSVLTLTLTGNITVNVDYSNSKIWDFSELTAGDITKVTESNGLYYRAGEAGRKITVTANTNNSFTWNFPDGTTYTSANKTGNTVKVPGNSTLAPADDLTPATKLDETLTNADDSNNRTLAFTTTQAGTVYVAYRGTAERDYKLFFKGESDESYSLVVSNQVNGNDSNKGMLFYTASESGNFLIGGSGDMTAYAIKFVPAETVYTLTETANPAESGSVKKEIIYGDESNPSYYETLGNTFLAGTKLRLTPSAGVGYGFSYWGDTATDTDESKTITMSENQSVKVNFTEVKHVVTVAEAENGTVALQVGGETVALTDGKAEVGQGAEVTILPTPTLFYGVKTISVTKTGDETTTVEVTNGKFTLPDYDVTVTATFAEEYKYSAKEAKAWTFGDAADETAAITNYGEDGLYLRGSASKKFTKVESGTVTSVTLADEAVAVSSALQTPSTFTAPDAGNTSATAVSPINGGSGVPMIAVNAATRGTVYIAASPVADGNGQIRIYFGDGTDKPTQMVNPAMTSKDQVYTASYTTYVPGTFYLGTTVAANIYAVKFVPAGSTTDGVTLTKDGSSYVLSNGKVTAVINKKGRVDQLLTEDGKTILKAGDSDLGCLDYTSNGTNRELQKGSEALTIKTVKETSDMVELLFTNDKNSLAQTWSVGYIMRKDVSGLYTYATMEGAKDGSYQEARFKWRANETFNYAWVNDNLKGQMPTKEQLANPAETIQDATFRLDDGTIYTKYDWANYMKDDQLHGVMNTTNGLWAIAPNMEWMNGGVQKQDLTVHADMKGPVLLQTLQSEHFGAATYTVATGTKQFYGPTLLYVNSGDTKEAMISDAKAKAAEEVAAWPYAWFTNDNYPAAEARGTVKGTVTLNSDDFNTTKLQVILADANASEPLTQVGGYQYATEVTSSNGSYSFTMEHVRPGTYAVFAYALNGDATGTLKSAETYTVAAGNNDLGTIAWTPKKHIKKLWQIGETDHTTSGFKLSDKPRQYGLFEQVPATLTYTVGTSSAANDWYFMQTKDNSTWTVKFDLDKADAKPLQLTIAVAGASRKPKLEVKMNDNSVYSTTYADNDGAIYRSGVLTGKYGVIEVAIPAEYVQEGANELALTLSGGGSGVGGLMYDCIKLETADEPEVHGYYDFRTFATENITLAEGVSSALATPELLSGVMTGNFTLDAAQGTLSGETMTLNEAFSLTDVNNFKLRKNTNTASTGLMMQEKRSGSALTINSLKKGDWFKIEMSGTAYFKTENAKVAKFHGEGTVKADDVVESGAIYQVSGNTRVEIYNSDAGNVHIYTITISDDDFVSNPTVELKDVEGDVAAIYTITFDEGSTLHYQLSTSEEEFNGGTTGSYDLRITEGAKLTAWATKGNAISGNLEATVYAPIPAPCEEGTYDFGEASAELPADIPVTLATKNAVTVEGETFYKPTALTAATFDDKFAFSETTTDDQIKIRTNRQLTFARGTDLDMAILNVTKGDIIGLDYSGGSIEFSASDIITTDQSALVNTSRRAVAENQTLESGETYVATGDGNLILHLRLASSAVNIAKMVLTKVAEPSEPKALNFVTAMDNEEALEAGKNVSVYVNGSRTASQFVRLANTTEDIPSDGKISTQAGRGSLTTGGLKMDKNRFAIHNLAVGDKILIRFYGGELTFENHETKGDIASIESTGVQLQPGDVMESGVIITVDKVDYLNNYLVFKADGRCIISGIFINHDEVESIVSPILRERSNGLIQITPGRSTIGSDVFTCYTTDGTDPSMTNGTSGLMTEMFEVELRELYACDITLKVISYSRDGAMSKMVTMTVHVDGSITGIDGVPTVNGQQLDIYDLRGRKVQQMQKGQVYIIGGKKYLYK